MDHNNSDEKKYSCGNNTNCACSSGISEKKHCMCPHRKCKDHDPEWKNIEIKLIPNPGIFGTKTYWFKCCCGKGMARCQKVQMQQCAKCGRIRHKFIENLAVCDCCGYHRGFNTNDLNDFGLIP